MNQTDNQLSNNKQRNLKISGINIEEGLERVGDDIEIYQQILELFYNNEGNCLNQLLKYLDTSDSAHAIQLLHSIKGSAGNISANNLSSAAQLLEQAIKNHTTELDPLIINFRKQFDIVFNALGTHLKQEQQETNTDLSITDTDNLIDYLPSIIKALEEYDTNVQAQITEIAPLFNNSAQREVFKKVQQSIEVFEFDQALAMMQALQDQISTDSE